MTSHQVLSSPGAASFADGAPFTFDPFADRHLPQIDRALQNSIKIVEKDKLFRSGLHGPLIQREKYSSNYWRHWNKEKNLLEDISYDEVVNHNSGSIFSSGSQNLALSPAKASHSLSRHSKKSVPPLRKMKNSGRINSVSFAAPDAYYKLHKKFDPRNLGKTSVEFLMESCLKQKIPVNYAEFNATIDPDDIGVRHTKGALLNIAPRLAPVATNITAKCDYPPLDDAVNPHKGFTWGTNPRFKAETPKPIVADDASLSTIERPSPAPGIVFDRADRFPDRDSRPSVIVKIPVQDANVSLLSGDESVAPSRAAENDVANTNKSANENDHDNGDEEHSWSEQDHIEPINAIKLPQLAASHAVHCNVAQSAGTVDDEAFGTENEIKLPRQSNGNAESSADPSLPSREHAPSAVKKAADSDVVKVPPKYIEYEYFPDDRPGPGHYQVERLFDNVKGSRAMDFDALIDKYSKVKPGLAGLSCADVSNVAVFGQECNRHEHVLYGMCLDGKCCRRSETEKFMLRRNDLRRLAGYEGVAKHGRNKQKLAGEMLYSATMRELLPEARYPVQPLYAAAYNGDIDAIRSLSKLDINPNVKHPSSGYTALHAAVFHCKLDAVAALLAYFRGKLALDAQDKKGDTALHIASRLGFVEIASAICNEDSCDPLCVKNNDNMYPIDVVKSHKVWQMIKVCQTRNELRQELLALKKP